MTTTKVQAQANYQHYQHNRQKNNARENSIRYIKKLMVKIE